MLKSTEERFWNRVNKTETCWLWTGGRTDRGYGGFSVKESTARRFISAHRYAYELLVGPIALGLTLDHTCRNRACVNPAHLEPVSLTENIARARVFRPVATHCKHGHEFTPDNTHVRDGQRICRACGRRRINLFRSKAA